MVNRKDMNCRKAFATTFATTDPNVTFTKLSQSFRALDVHLRGPLQYPHEPHLNVFLECF